MSGKSNNGGVKKPFLLNAPQAVDEPNERNSFASMGDMLENSLPGYGIRSNAASVNLSGRNFPNAVNHPEQQQPEQSARPEMMGGPNQYPPSSGAVPPQLQQQQQQDERLAALAASAARINAQDGDEDRRGLPLRCLIIVGVVVIVLLVGLIVAVAVVLTGTRAGGNPDDSGGAVAPLGPTQPPVSIAPPTPSPTSSPPTPLEPTPVPATTLGQIRQRGKLNCGVPEQPGFAIRNLETDEWEGFDADLCRAVGAGIFGEGGHVNFVPLSAFDRFQSLNNGVVDMLARTTTHTMERDVLERTSNAGFSFSIPYLYNGVQFAGLPFYVTCADNGDVEGECQNTRICALDGTTHVAVIGSVNPELRVVSVVNSISLYRSFIDGFCNVIAGEQFDIAPSIVEAQGYNGEFEVGTVVHSKEPLAMVTRDDDPEFSDFVNWIMEALIAAEDSGIRQSTAYLLGSTDVFGPDYRFLFSNAVSEVGNYGEIYDRNLKDILPRPAADRINPGNTGLIYAFPFGSLDRNGPGPISGGTLDTILQRGYLNCGISRRAIFAQLDNESQKWRGFDVDFCEALAAAIFDGEPGKVRYQDLTAKVRFEALQNGDVDVLSRLTTVTLARDVNEPSTGVGFSFTQPNFYDGLTFGGVPTFASCADNRDVTSTQCQALKICVNEGTTFATRVKELFHSRFIVERLSGELSIEGLSTGDCNVIAGGVVDVSTTSVRSSGFMGAYGTGSRRFSKDPLALVTRQDDEQWSEFVFWIVSAIFYAEEQGITQATALEMPTVTLFGRLQGMFQNAVAAVGNYGEIYERNAQQDIPRSGLNSLNRLLNTPQFYPLPGI